MKADKSNALMETASAINAVIGLSWRHGILALFLCALKDIVTEIVCDSRMPGTVCGLNIFVETVLGIVLPESCLFFGKLLEILGVLDLIECLMFYVFEGANCNEQLKFDAVILDSTANSGDWSIANSRKIKVLEQQIGWLFDITKRNREGSS